MSKEAPETCTAGTSPETAVSIAEAARRVGVSRRTLYRAMETGKLATQPDGRLALADLLALGYELGPGGKSSVLAVRLLDELQAAQARERALLLQQLEAQAQERAVLQQQAVALADQLDALRQELAACRFQASAPPPPSHPGGWRWRASRSCCCKTTVLQTAVLQAVA